MIPTIADARSGRRKICEMLDCRFGSVRVVVATAADCGAGDGVGSGDGEGDGVGAETIAGVGVGVAAGAATVFRSRCKTNPLVATAKAD